MMMMEPFPWNSHRRDLSRRRVGSNPWEEMIVIASIDQLSCEKSNEEWRMRRRR